MNAAPTAKASHVNGNANRPDLVRLGVLAAADTEARIAWSVNASSGMKAVDAERSIIRQWAGRTRVVPCTGRPGRRCAKVEFETRGLYRNLK